MDRREPFVQDNSPQHRHDWNRVGHRRGKDDRARLQQLIEEQHAQRGADGAQNGDIAQCRGGGGVGAHGVEEARAGEKKNERRKAYRRERDRGHEHRSPFGEKSLHQVHVGAVGDRRDQHERGVREIRRAIHLRASRHREQSCAHDPDYDSDDVRHRKALPEKQPRENKSEDGDHRREHPHYGRRQDGFGLCVEKCRERIPGEADDEQQCDLALAELAEMLEGEGEEAQRGDAHANECELERVEPLQPFLHEDEGAPPEDRQQDEYDPCTRAIS